MTRAAMQRPTIKSVRRQLFIDDDDDDTFMERSSKRVCYGDART